MEDVYSIKVKTKPDTRNLYPSERRYSASTVSGLAWVHLALAVTSFLLACLAIANPNAEQIDHLNVKDIKLQSVDRDELLFNLTYETTTQWIPENDTVKETTPKDESYNYILVIAPTLITIFALAAGIAAIMASVRWYIDKNIAWLFLTSIMSSLIALVSFAMIAVWVIGSSEGSHISTSDRDILVIKHSDVLDKNDSHLVIAKNSSENNELTSPLFTKRVLSINILIAAFLELLWSILSVKISYKGMRNNYKDDSERRGNCISVVTTVKGNNTGQQRNRKMLSPKPDILSKCANGRIKNMFMSNRKVYLNNQSNDDKFTKPDTDTSSEFYKERMINFLNRCASLEGMSEPEVAPSVQSETDISIKTIPEVVNVEINAINGSIGREKSMTPISWGDTPDHTIYNQNTLNLTDILKFVTKKNQDVGDSKESEKHSSEQVEITLNN